MARRALLPLLCLALSGTAAPARAQELSPRASYILHCSGCHGMTGGGATAAGIPDFSGSVGHIATLDLGRTYIMHVPGVVSASLSDAEIAEVMNYVLDAWGDGRGAPFTPEEVTRRRAAPVEDVVAFRRSVAEEMGRRGLPIAEYPWP